MNALCRRNNGLDSLELKALSVPSSLRFLLDVEYSIVLCVTEVGSNRQFSLRFPPFADMFRKLIGLCATRFALECVHSEEGSVLHGVAVMPLLRYADYLPGALHLDELLACLQVEPMDKLRRRGQSETEDAAAPSTNVFEAPFSDSDAFSSDAALSDVHGLGFYLTLDYGVSLASHGHLVGIRLHEDWDPTEALREFQEFSGWSRFDLRFYEDEDKRQGGIIVMPTVADACDLLERYEDEDSDDEGDLLPFILRPVCPLISVPAVEDSALRKLREQHWDEIVSFWERFPRTKNTVVVYNLYDGAVLADVLGFVEGLPVVASQLIEDESPMHRRKVFITFETAEAAKKALELDGKSTKGRSLRVQVSPPYISELRRGREVRPATPVTLSQVPATPSNHQSGNGNPNHHKNGSAKPSPTLNAQLAATFVPATVTTTVTSPAAAAAAAAISCALRRAQQHDTQPPSADHPTSGVPLPRASTAVFKDAQLAIDDGKSSSSPSLQPSPSLMNASAKEFVPKFLLNANSPEYCPGATPKYDFANAPAMPPAMFLGNTASSAGGLMPPPPPPPSYQAAVSPSITLMSAPPSCPTSTSLRHDGVGVGELPPAYNLPPAYSSGAAVPADGILGAPHKLPPPPPYRGS